MSGKQVYVTQNDEKVPKNGHFLAFWEKYDFKDWLFCTWITDFQLYINALGLKMSQIIRKSWYTFTLSYLY